MPFLVPTITNWKAMPFSTFTTLIESERVLWSMVWLCFLSKQKDQQFEGGCWWQSVFTLPHTTFIPKEPGPIPRVLHPEEKAVTRCWGTVFHIPSHQHHQNLRLPSWDLLIPRTQQPHSNTVVRDGDSHHIARRLTTTTEAKMRQNGSRY